MAENDNMIELFDEENNSIKCELLDIVDYEGKQYAVLALEDSEETGEVMIMEFVPGDEDSDSDDLISVEDEAVLDAVLDLFNSRYADEADDAENGEEG